MLSLALNFAEILFYPSEMLHNAASGWQQKYSENSFSGEGPSPFSDSR